MAAAVSEHAAKILRCPGCETEYEIPVEIPAEGRKVRCSSCDHVWLATPDDMVKPPPVPESGEDDEIVFKDVEEETEPAAEAAEPEAEPESGSEPEKEPEAEPEPEPQEEPEPEPQEEPEPEPQEEPEPEPDKEAGPEKEPEPDEEPGEETGEDKEPGEEKRPETFAEHYGEVEEEETPPIVVGKSRRRFQIPRSLAVGWGAFGLLAAGLIAFVMLNPAAIVRALPGTAWVYEAAGKPVNLRGLEFRDVAYTWDTEPGKVVLEVSGNIANVADEAVRIPTVMFVLRDENGTEVFQWAADIRDAPLPAGEHTGFRTRIPSPPKAVRSVQVHFVKAR